MIRIHSLTARLATLFAVLAASLLVLAAMLFGRMLDMHFQELDMHELQGKVTLIRNALQSVDATGGDRNALRRSNAPSLDMKVSVSWFATSRDASCTSSIPSISPPPSGQANPFHAR